MCAQHRKVLLYGVAHLELRSRWVHSTGKSFLFPTLRARLDRVKVCHPRRKADQHSAGPRHLRHGRSCPAVLRCPLRTGPLWRSPILSFAQDGCVVLEGNPFSHTPRTTWSTLSVSPTDQPRSVTNDVHSRAAHMPIQARKHRRDGAAPRVRRFLRFPAGLAVSLAARGPMGARCAPSAVYAGRVGPSGLKGGSGSDSRRARIAQLKARCETTTQKAMATLQDWPLETPLNSCRTKRA